MNAAIIEQVRRNLAALDLSAENDEIAELDLKMAETDEALQRGQIDLQEAVQAARDGRKPDGNAVANALVGGVAVDAMTADRWREKADQLRAGLAALGSRNSTLYERRRNVERRAVEKVQGALAPLLEAQREAAQAAYDSLVSLKAACQFLAYARLTDAELETDLRRLVVLDLRGCMKRPQAHQPTPAWITAIAPDLAKLGPAFAPPTMPGTITL